MRHRRSKRAWFERVALTVHVVGIVVGLIEIFVVLTVHP
jgi:hypothetical protein